ncbi:hypothetical protein A6U87_16620 [Rhizobium sp. AC44/96]|nr:hypothetical protein A6U87_16620 [Rhizobium sp. AC44/96]
MQAAIKAYLKSMRVVLCEREPIAYLKMSTTTWITGETVPAAVMSDEEHHSAFPVYRGIND